MAIAEKKPTRKELLKEPDQFITFSGKMIEFAQRHRRPLTYAAVAIACVTVIFTATRYFIARAENRAFSLLDHHTAQYQQAIQEKTPEEARAQVREGFEALIADYGGRAGGKLARIRYADICDAAGDTDRAIELYRQALTDFADEPFYRALILNSLGYAHAQKQDWDAAIGYLKQVADLPDAPLRDKALFVLAGIYDSRGSSQEAKAAYQRLLKEFADSSYADVARERANG